MANSKTRLGRGLGALISGGASTGKQTSSATKSAPKKSASAANAKPEPAKEAPVIDNAKPVAGFQEVAVGKVEANPFQPRRDFRPEQLAELAESIRAEGLLQPIVVRAVGDKFQLIAGERRWRAFQQLKLKVIPARVITAGDFSSASMALIENLQRENLNPMEEAQGYASLIRDFDLTQESVAERVGKGRATVANSLRLLALDPEIQGFIATGMLSTGHAKALMGIEAKPEQLALSRRIIEEGLSVRATEKLVQNVKQGRGFQVKAGRAVPPAEKAAIADIEKKLGSHLSAQVALKHTPKKGRIVIEYRGNDDLQRILEKLGVAE